jgi:uncharacterized membrane protein YbhN (UPF0104 family)
MKQFNFYNLIELKFDYGEYKAYEKYFDNEYARIAAPTKANKNIEPAIVIKIVKRLPDAQRYDILRTEKFKKLFNYSFVIRGLDKSKTEIYFKHHWADRIYINAVAVFLQTNILEPVTYYKLLKKNVVLLHAAGVAKNGAGVLMPAYGGTGKTTFSMALLNEGFKLLGDDLLLVDTRQKIVYPYPRPLHLFTYNVNSLRGGKLPVKYKFIIYSKNILRFFLEKLLHTDFMIATRVHTDEIYSGKLFANVVPYKKLVFLRKTGPLEEIIKVNQKSSKIIAEEINNSADLNKSLYAILDDKKRISAVKRIELKSTQRLVLQFDSIFYLNTRKLNLTDLESNIGRVLMTARTKHIVFRIIFFGFIFAFFAYYLTTINYSSLSSLKINWQLMALASLTSLGFRYWGAFIWRTILIDLGAKQLPPFRILVDIYAKAWMGRYIPGTVTWIAGKVYLASRLGISKSRLAVASLLEGSMQIVAVMAISLIIIGLEPRLNVIPLSVKLAMAALGIVLVLILKPSIFNKFVRKAYKLVRKKEAYSELNTNSKATIRSFILYGIGAFISGTAFFFLTMAIAPNVTWHMYFYLVGAFNLAGAVGMLAIFVPSGLGVRDGLLLVLLNAVFPPEIALVITIVSRLWSAIIDVLFLAVARTSNSKLITNLVG